MWLCVHCSVQTGQCCCSPHIKYADTLGTRGVLTGADIQEEFLGHSTCMELNQLEWPLSSMAPRVVLPEVMLRD